VEGAIVPGRPQPSPFGSQGIAYSDPIRKALDKAAQDDSVKAVVLRVNSPGGSAVASEIILQATRRVAAKKPLVVSMGDVAGSGGYYVACGTETIFADASTITASIGVVAGKLVTKEMWESIGINWHPIQRGKNADMLATAEVFSDEQKQIMQSWMDEVYEVFKNHVVSARGDRLAKPIDEIAGGRVYTGQQALELGLVDRLGSLRDAVDFAADKAELKSGQYDVRVIPKPKNLMELMLSDLVGESDEDGEISYRPLRPLQPIWEAVGTLIDRLQPQHVAALKRSLIQLEILQQEGITLAMPEFVFE
jgi:protease-4